MKSKRCDKQPTIESARPSIDIPSGRRTCYQRLGSDAESYLLKRLQFRLGLLVAVVSFQFNFHGLTLYEQTQSLSVQAT